MGHETINSPEIGLHIHSQLMSDKEVKSVTLRKTVFLMNSAGTTECPYLKKMKLDTDFLYLSSKLTQNRSQTNM